MSGRERAERLAWSASDIRSLLEENARLREALEVAAACEFASPSRAVARTALASLVEGDE